jgi:hypothetical protein
MRPDRESEEHARINPAARRDRPGEPREDLARSDREPDDPPPKGYQEADLDPRDNSGIAE